jgi:hypothetical protein
METYETPTFEELGSVRELTLANASGAHLDAGFPAHTPVGQLTFS